MDEAVDVRPVSAQDWPDVETVFATRGDPRRCWCQWFRLRGKDFEAASVVQRQAALRAECEGTDPGPGVLARLDGVPAGWAAVAPRAGYPRLLASAMLRGLPAEPVAGEGVWAVTCFVVRPEFRSRGLARALLDGAVAHARSAGAQVIEGYPIDVTAAGSVSTSLLYHGALSTFLTAGFTEVARPRPGRPVVRLIVG